MLRSIGAVLILRLGSSRLLAFGLHLRHSDPGELLVDRVALARGLLGFFEKALEAREQIDQILLDAMSQGKPTPMTRANWNRIRATGLKQAQERRKK